MNFADRSVAGKQLAEKLELHLKQLNLMDSNKLLVVGLPRGGVPVALEIARKLNCPLDIIVAKKIPFPGQPEYAIGAVSSDGAAIFNSPLVERHHLQDYIEKEIQRLLKQTKESENDFHVLGKCRPTTFKEKVVVLVDDGIATGMTAIAAAESARARGAERIIIAAPVMSIESYNDLSQYCDDVIAISLPDEFLAVGNHYDTFTQTTNAEVVHALQAAG